MAAYPFISSVLTVSMLLSPWAAAAGGAASGSAAASGNAEMIYLNTDVYSLVLPTSDVLDFTLDPQGLTRLPDNGYALLADLTEYAGKIVSNNESVALVYNEGSKPVKVSVHIKAVQSGAKQAAFVQSVDAVEDDGPMEGRNILLVAVPTAAGQPISSYAEYEPSGKGIILGEDSRKVELYLEPAEYVATNNGTPDSPNYIYEYSGSGDGSGFKIGGLVNKDADWSEFAQQGGSTVGVTAVFDFEEAGAARPQMAAYAYGVVDDPVLKTIDLKQDVGHTLSLADRKDIAYSVIVASDRNLYKVTIKGAGSDETPVTAPAGYTYNAETGEFILKTSTAAFVNNLAPGSYTVTLTFSVGINLSTSKTVPLIVTE